jgi:Photoprotection regulator fluorescence recovery protein
MTSPSATQDRFPYQNEPIWSRSEKTVARAAFDAALKRELQEIMQEAKQMANQTNEPADLWDLEHHLTQRRKEIDRKYDFRSSRLADVLGRLLYENRLSEEDLRGLSEEKMKSIRSFAQFLTDDAA